MRLLILLDLLHQGVGSSEHYSPSGGKILNLPFESKAMTKEDILKIEDYFVQAALRAKKAGCDGVGWCSKGEDTGGLSKLCPQVCATV